MKQLSFIAFSVLILTQFATGQSLPVNCTGFSATYSTVESRCASTGSITINPTGGSGNYSYKVLEPQALPLTSTATITGLPPGTYTVMTKDMETGCTLVQEDIIVAGSYNDPRFQLTKTDVTCINGTDGTISVTGLQNGRNPFTYKIIAPSASAVGTINSTGIFNSLKAGDYYIQLMDSCGGIQTRTVAIQDYNWSITNSPISKLNCNTAAVAVTLADNKGNTNLSGTSFSGFQYGVVNGPGDTTWHASSTFNYTKNPLRKVTVVVKDRCGSVKSVSWQNAAPSLDAGQAISNLICNTFDVKVTTPLNFTNGQAYLKQGSTIIQSNSTGIFTGVPYGSYCIEARDNCYDTTISRCFTVNRPVPSVNAVVDTSNQQCNSFTAKISGQTNLFNATYNLYNASNTLISTNSTGLFTNLSYGSYCIKIVSSLPCYDTTINRCFTVNMPKPSVQADPIYSSQTCSNYKASIAGQLNLFNPNYCLYLDNVLVGCNLTGNFPGLTYGANYCIKIVSSSPCYDTTITRCFNKSKPQPATGSPTLVTRYCTAFSVKIPSVSNIPDPKYCLYNSANTLIECNTSGFFDNVPYGTNYYITTVTTSTTTDCPVVTVKKTFSVTAKAPTVSATPAISAKNCTSFTAKFTVADFIDPQYCLYNGLGNLVSCSPTSTTYTNLPYGSYTFVATNSCGQVLTRTFTEAPTPLVFSLQALESCTLNATDVKVTVSAGAGPFVLKVLNPLNTVIATQSTSSTTYTFTALPALVGSLQYRIAVVPACGASDTISVSPKTSAFSRATSVLSKCPSAASENGSGNISVELNSNIGLYAPKIIKKNSSAASINPTVTTNLTATSRKYEFLELAPATYVLEYNISTCSKKVYDTITVTPYAYPDLKNSAGYQCDNNNFSVSAVAGGGVSPFNYEIIGSNPTGPSIVTPVQTNSVFDILTGASYSLVRMRAVDACGNGTLNDVSVLPLGQLTISVDNVDCYSNNLTLKVDTIPNATYTWYLKKNATDSTQIATNQSYNIPYLLPTDTGMYVCKTSVNNGCLMRLSYYHLKGDCSIILPVKISGFTGRLSGNDVLLNWNVSQEERIKEYQVERSTNSGSFEKIGIVSATNDPAMNRYSFTDVNVPGGRLKYRLKIISQDNNHTYSPTIEIIHNGVFITAAPNPVKQVLNISISAKTDAAYDIKLYNLNGQVMHQQTTNRIRSGTFSIQRNGKMTAGIYFVKIMNLDTGEMFTHKLMYE